MSADTEATQTFSPSSGPDSGSGRRVELFDPDSIEERVLGERRPVTFEERYPFAGRVGEGGMGEVFLARDAVLARDVAIKVLRKKVSADARIVRRFLREAQVTAQLEHPNVVPFHALESTGEGAPAFVMKLIEGETFKDYARRCKQAWGTPSWDRAEFGVKARVELFLKVCDALAYSHSRGVLHRDIKPSNIMRGDFNVVYVMDWGIARIVGAQDEGESFSIEGADSPELPETRTMTGDLVGTPLYMSPEQVTRRSDELTPASDQYSLGLLLFNLLTCERPRGGSDVFDVLERAGRGELEPFPQTGPAREVPRELRAIVERATRPNPGLRYASVSELAADLRRFLHGEEVRAYPDNFVRAIWRKVARHPTATLGALLGIVSLAGATTTWSLVAQLEQREVAERRTELLTTLVSDVTHHVHQLDRGMSLTERVLATLAVDVERRLAWRPESEPVGLSPADLRGPDAPPDTRLEAAYGHGVSFSAPMRLVMPDADLAKVRAQERKLGDLTELLRFPFIGEARELERRAAAAGTPGVLSRESSTHYSYLGFDSGLYYSFPAMDYAAPGYDHRERPWYKRGERAEQPLWGQGYPDAAGSGYLLPCLVAVHGPDGERVGVAGLSVLMDSVIQQLKVPSVKQAQVVLLVDRDAGILIDSRERGESPTPGLHGNRMKEPGPVEDPELKRALAGDEPSGVVLTDAAIYAWARFQTIENWVLVVGLPADFLPD